MAVEALLLKDAVPELGDRIEIDVTRDHGRCKCLCRGLCEEGAWQGEQCGRYVHDHEPTQERDSLHRTPSRARDVAHRATLPLSCLRAKHPRMITDPLFYAAAIPAVMLLGLAKGGFSGIG